MKEADDHDHGAGRDQREEEDGVRLLSVAQRLVIVRGLKHG